ncbi:MAG: DUF2721 domain-containing protein [Gammaproteobacteria bacterium]
MDINIATPALLFPAISVLFLAYANRYLAIANRIRGLHDLFNKTQSHVAKRQIETLRIRLRLIITMQCFAVLGIISCILSMGFIFFGSPAWGKTAFGASLALIAFSLFTSLSELLISTRALNIELADMEE